MGLCRQTGTAGTRTKARGMLSVPTRRPAALQEQQLSQEPRALAVRWRHRAVTDPRLALCCACVVPSCRPPRLRVGYVRAAPPAAEGRLTHAQCYSRLRGLLSAPLRAERERRAAHALAGSGFSRPVGFPPRPEVTVGRCVVAPQSSAHLRSSFHGSKTLMAGQWKSIPCSWRLGSTDELSCKFKATGRLSKHRAASRIANLLQILFEGAQNFLQHMKKIWLQTPSASMRKHFVFA